MSTNGIGQVPTGLEQVERVGDAAQKLESLIGSDWSDLPEAEEGQRKANGWARPQPTDKQQSQRSEKKEERQRSKTREERAAEQQAADDQAEGDDVEYIEVDEDGNEIEASGDEERQAEEAEAYIATLAELAESQGASLEDLLPLKHRIKAAGEEHEVTLQDLVTGFQQGTDYTAKTTRLAEQRRQLEAQEIQRVQQFQEQMEGVARSLAQSEQYVRSLYDTERMRQLRQDNPAEWALAKDELDQAYWSVTQQMQQAHAHYDAQREQMKQQWQARELELIKEAIPEWGPEAVRATEAIAQEYGLNPDEIKFVGTSSRLTRALYDLGRANKAKATQADKAKKVKRIMKRVKKAAAEAEEPKTAKPGKGKSLRRGQAKSLQKARNVKSAVGKLRKSGKRGDAADAIAALGLDQF